MEVELLLDVLVLLDEDESIDVVLEHGGRIEVLLESERVLLVESVELPPLMMTVELLEDAMHAGGSTEVELLLLLTFPFEFAAGLMAIAFG